MLRSISRAAKGPFVALQRHASTKTSDKDVVIVSGARTPIGNFQGALSSFSAVQLGAHVSKAALERAGVKPDEVDEVIMGNVISAGLGQAPARQVALGSGLPPSVVCTTVNKVCSSGMKAITMGAQSLMTGQSSRIVLAGGMESMSNVPFYMPQKSRSGLGYGHQQVLDGLLHDGLTDAFDNHHMGMCAEACAVEYGITREEQDKYTIESYRRAAEATKSGAFKEEIAPVTLPLKKGEKAARVLAEDEGYANIDEKKMVTLKPVFKKDGTVTAANASKINDGATAVTLCTYGYAKSRGLTPIGRILGFADAERKPLEFPTAPALAIPKALKHAGLQTSDVHFWEVNEAFAVVALANAKLLKLDQSRLNVHGGGVALGHPIGSSGARLVVTLLSILKQKQGTIGVAGICNGGGGATAIVLERL